MIYSHKQGVAQGLSKASIIALAVGFALTLVLSVFSFADAAPGANEIQINNTGAVYTSVQDAVNASTAGDTINIGPGTFVGTVDVPKNLTFVGSGQGVTILDVSGTDYGFADNDLGVDVVMEDFSVIDAGHYGVKFSGGTAEIRNVTVSNSARTEMDFNGMSSVIIENVTLDGNGTSGNGLSFTDSENISVNGLTTIDNAWGGTAIYTYGRYYPLGSDNILLENIDGQEANPLYTQVDNYNNPGSPGAITNLVANQFPCTVVNPTHRAGGENFTFYQYNEPEAQAFAALFPVPGDSVVTCLVEGEITAPNAGEVISGSLELLATYNDSNTTDTDEIFWAVRSATCDVNAAANVAGNVTGVNDPYAWDNENFSATIDVSGWTDGDYCFIFNPNASEDDVRETREFVVDNTAPGQVDGMTILQNSIDIGCDASVTERLITVDWNDSTDPNFDYYNYQADNGVGSVDFTTTVAVSERTGQIRDTDGTYQYRVQAVDTAGNVGDWSDWCMVTLDREAPVVSIDEPLDGAVISGTVDIVGDVTDNLDLSHYNLSLYPSTTDLSDGDTHSGDRLNDVNWCTTPTGGTVNLTASIVDELLCDDWDTTYLADGDYQIRLAARDASGLRDLSDPFSAGTSSVHVIDITIDNEGELLGAVTDGNENDGREVLGDNTEDGEVLDSHTLSETGDAAIWTTLLSLVAITVALGAARFSRR